MIGQLTFAKPKNLVAVLDESGRWQCPDKVIEMHLNVNYNPRDQHGPSVMPFGYVALDKAAHDLKAKATHAQEVGKLPPDVVS
jgi:hypothetical protein